MIILYGGIFMSDCCERSKRETRSEEEITKISNRMNRLIGQLQGVKKMIEENRYCLDVLIQLSAVQSALKEVSYMILKEHLDTCVTQDILEGKLDSIDETMEIIKKIK